MFKNIWKCIVYIMSGDLMQADLDAYVASQNPKNEEERLNAIREYCFRRGGY